MPKLVFIFVLYWLFCLKTIENISPKTVQYSTNKQSSGDTVFILREKTKNYDHKVFIEKDRKSKYYSRLTDFKFDKYNIESFEMAYKALKEKYPNRLTSHNTYGLPTEWLPLHRYKDKYYLYAPSDWGNAGRRIITDSVLIYWYMDGPYPEQLQEIKKISTDKYALASRNFYDADTTYRDLIIHMIDKVNKIAIWEYPIENHSSHYEMYVAKENAKNFDLIVNYCEQSKTVEFDFDKIDYKQLLDSH